jgi:hypothetical protein
MPGNDNARLIGAGAINKNQHPAGISASPTLPPAADITALCQAYVVLLVGRSGNYVRKPYVSLHSAQQALQRAQDRGQHAHLVLCRLTPITADLGPDGGDQQ